MLYNGMILGEVKCKGSNYCCKYVNLSNNGAQMR